MVSSVFSRARWKSAGKHFENWSMMRYRIALNLWTSFTRGETRKSRGETIDQKSGRHRKCGLENIFTGVKIWTRIPIINEAPASFLLRCSFPAARPRSSRKLFNKGANWRLILGRRNISRTILFLHSFPRKFKHFLFPSPFLLHRSNNTSSLAGKGKHILVLLS